MVVMGVISKVSQTSEWFAGIVVVSKHSGDVHIDVDLKTINESVRRKVHLILEVDETLA